MLRGIGVEAAGWRADFVIPIIAASEMSTQENNFSRRERLRRTALAGVAAILMGASLVYGERVGTQH
jgi:hypothetical protein